MEHDNIKVNTILERYYTEEMESDLWSEYYYQGLKECFEKGLDTRITNNDPRHARLILAEIFYRSDEHIRLVTGTMQSICKDSEGEDVPVYSWKPLKESVREFLERKNTKLEILAIDSYDTSPGNLWDVLKDYAGKVTTFCANGNIKIHRDSDKSEDCHFIVGDGRMLRFEAYSDDIQATASANNPEFAERLTRGFDKILDDKKDKIVSVPLS